MPDPVHRRSRDSSPTGLRLCDPDLVMLAPDLMTVTTERDEGTLLQWNGPAQPRPL